MPTSEFQTFGLPHIIAMVLTLALPILLARLAHSHAVASAIAFLLAGALLLNEVVHWVYKLVEVGFIRYLQYHLPLHLCEISILLMAATLLFRNQRIYEIVYFWGLVGSVNAVITPSIEEGFPGYLFFQFFITHSGIVVGILYATWGLGMRPSLSGLFRAFVYINLFAVTVGMLNFLTGSNYMFLSQPPPETVSPFFFAPWPWYILYIEFIGLAMFFAVLSPFLVIDIIRAGQGRRMWCQSKNRSEFTKSTGEGDRET